MKLNKPMKLKVGLLLVAMVIAGCGTETSTKNDKVLAPAPVAPVPGQVQTGAVLPNVFTSPIQSVFGPRQRGMYDAIGREDMGSQQVQFNAQQPYPASRNWITRVEILTDTAQNSDPASFNTPTVALKYIRITLVNDANLALRYTAEGYVWVSFYAKLVGDLRGYVGNTPQFDIHFGVNGQTTGPLLGVLGMDGRIYNGVIELVENVNGQSVRHIIQY